MNLFLENEEEEDKDSIGSSSESLEYNKDIDIELSKYEIKVSKNPFDLKKIFTKSQNVFNPMISIEDILLYKRDLNIPRFIDNLNFKFNHNYYLPNIVDIFLNTKNLLNYYLYNEKSGLTLSVLQTLEKIRNIFNKRYFYFNSELLEDYHKKYFYFRIAKLFKPEESDLFLEILKSKEGDEIIDYTSEYLVNILKKILAKFSDIYIIFDNIKNSSDLKLILYTIE